MCQRRCPQEDQPDSALDTAIPGAGLSLGWVQSTTVNLGRNPGQPVVADCCLRVLATRFWKVSNGQLVRLPSTLYHRDDC